MEMNVRHMRRAYRKENTTLHLLSNRVIFALSYNFYYAALMAHHLDYMLYNALNREFPLVRKI